MTKNKRGEPRENPTPLPIAPELLAAHSGISEALAQWKESKRIPPVLLLTGPRGCGKREIAYFIAEALQCERTGFFEAPESDGLFGGGGGFDFGSAENGAVANSALPCGECAACSRAVSGQALDFTEVRIAEDEKTLGVDRFREIKEKQGFSSFGGGEFRTKNARRAADRVGLSPNRIGSFSSSFDRRFAMSDAPPSTARRLGRRRAPHE